MKIKITDEADYLNWSETEDLEMIEEDFLVVTRTLVIIFSFTFHIFLCFH